MLAPLATILRCGFVVLALASSASCSAQQIDSVHVFKQVPAQRCTSGSANAMVWQLHQKHASHTALYGRDVKNVADALAGYKPARHTYGQLDDLAYLAMAYSGGRPLAFGITGDLDRVINFTARTEYRISTWTEHVKVRALLAKMLLERGL